MNEKEIIGKIEEKRVQCNLKLLPRTVSTLNSFVSYLAAVAVKQNRNPNQINLSLLIDCYAEELSEREGFQKWLSRGGARGEARDHLEDRNTMEQRTDSIVEEKKEAISKD